MGSSMAVALVTKFEETMRADLAALRTAINAGNVTQSGQIAHRALTLHPSPVDLRLLATTLSDQIRQPAARKGLAFRLDLDADLPPVVDVDRLRLQRKRRFRPIDFAIAAGLSTACFAL
jgi:signal transduction histidine kinase